MAEEEAALNTPLDNYEPPSPDPDDENDYILNCISKVNLDSNDTTVSDHEQVWLKYGTQLVHYSEVSSKATLLVKHLIMDTLIHNLELFQSSLITDLAWEIIGNLASHPTLLNEVASETRLIQHVERTLYSRDTNRLKQVCWFWSLVLESTTRDAWATELISEPNMNQISRILSATIRPELITRVTPCLKRVLTNQRNYMLVSSGLGTKLPKVLIRWLRLMLEGFVPKKDAYHAAIACIQMFELLSLLVEHSREDIAIDEVFEMLTSFIKSPHKFEVTGGFCVILADQISDMIGIEPKLILELSESKVFLEGILDLFQFANSSVWHILSLWNIIDKLLKHTSNRQLAEVLDNRVQCLEEELIVYQVGEMDDFHKQLIKRSVTTIKAYLVDVTDENIGSLRLLRCLNKCLVSSSDEACDEHYIKCVTSALSRGCGDDIWDDLKTIVKVKFERNIDDLDAAVMHMEIGKKLFPHTLETGERDGVLKQRRAFDTLIYISTLLFGKASSFLLPWRRVFEITDAEVEFAFSDNAQRLYGSSLSSVGRDIDAEKLINLREKQENYGLSDQLAEKMFRDHTCKLVEENILAALNTYVSRQTRQTIEELDKILDFNSRLVNFKKHPDAIRFAPGLGTIVLQDGGRNDDFRLLYRLYAMDCLSGGRMEGDKLAALNQLRDMFGLCEREVASIIAAITPASRRADKTNQETLDR